MNILAIETSCDETAIAILEVKGFLHPKARVLAHTVASQIELHSQYGGVFPAMAKREHSKNIFPVFIETLEKAGFLAYAKNPANLDTSKIKSILSREHDLAEIFLSQLPNIKKPKINKIVVTTGPGLAPALWVGISFAKALSTAWNIPIAPINHMEGHILSVVTNNNSEYFEISNKSFKLPAISLLISGGHTEIVLMKKIGSYKIIGQTRDDAAGEAFDKVARMLGLAYPGGPLVSKLAQEYRTTNQEKTISLPRPMIHSHDFDFSFSGLKTAVLYLLRDLGGKINQKTKEEIAAEFEDAVVDVLTHKTFAAITKYKARSLIVGGGVSANTELRKRFEKKSKELNIPVFFPAKNLSTDNAIMIAIAGYFAKPVSLSSKKLTAVGNLEL